MRIWPIGAAILTPSTPCRRCSSCPSFRGERERHGGGRGNKIRRQRPSVLARRDAAGGGSLGGPERCRWHFRPRPPSSPGGPVNSPDRGYQESQKGSQRGKQESLRDRRHLDKDQRSGKSRRGRDSHAHRQWTERRDTAEALLRQGGDLHV